MTVSTLQESGERDMLDTRNSRPWFAGAFLAMMALFMGSVNAQAVDPAGEVPVSDFFKRPTYIEMVMSPSGRYIATTSALFGRLNLVVIDLEQRKAVTLTHYDDMDIGRVQWVGEDYVLFSAIQLNSPTGGDAPRAGGLFVVARNGTGVLQLAKTARQLNRSQTGGFVALTYLRSIPGSKDEMIAAGVVTNDDSVDLYRVNLSNGRYRLLTQGRPSDRLQQWILDAKLVPRVALAGAVRPSTTNVVFYRKDADSAWSELSRFDSTMAPAMVPLALDTDGRRLFVASNAGRKNMAIFLYDPETKQFIEQIAQHPQYDLGASPTGQLLGSLLFEPATGELMGIRVDAETPQTLWLNAEMAKVQAALDATFPKRFNFIQRAGPNKRLLVNSFSDTSPGEFYIYDLTKGSLEKIGTSRPWLEGKLSPVRSFMLKTRDGLNIPSHYVLPLDYQPGQRRPTIVHIHGGPMARDVIHGGRFGASFGVSEAQILASRGYVVVLPNFRITPELGSDIFYAGFGTYGRQMSDDHEDAVRWAIDAGFTDPERVCISGASYGGYAALQAVSRPSNPFKCAVSGLPVTDLAFQHAEADYASFPAALQFWRRLHGVEDLKDPGLRRVSPLSNAGDIKVPVFMYIGENDTRTPPAQAHRMAEALSKAGNPVKDLFVGKGEGHGFGVEANNVQLYQRMLKFLADVLKP